MSNTYKDRINSLRELMTDHSVAAVIIPQTDPHQSEYLAPHWQVRRWFSGFTGSAGTLVVTHDNALMWVDSRYFIQAERQLDGTDIQIMKIAIAGTPTINEYLCSSLKPGDTVGVDGFLFSSTEYDKTLHELGSHDIKLKSDFDAATLWSDRPELSNSPVIVHDESLAGENAASKLQSLREFIKSNNADALLISALDEIAWVLNIRSRDVRCNPVTTAYLLVNNNGGTLFINPDKITPETAQHLSSLNITIAQYTSFDEYITQCVYPVVAIDPATTSARTIEALGLKVLRISSPIPLAKAIKNTTQIQGIRQAMVRDGVALVKSFIEIERRIGSGEHITETSIADILHRHRSEQELFFDESFDTIAGYGPHGAIVHYSATSDTDIAIGSDSLLLIDSGAQYLDGTTDITRTITIGEPSVTQRRHFSLVLKGNINLVTAVFPTGTRGTQLDVLAHLPLWLNGLNYLHGTGHGVGHFLNVHEGPHSIRTNDVPTPLQAGMVVTDEPGLYLEGQYGIRCENVLLVVPHSTTALGEFLTFEPLTLFPFDRRLIDPAILGTPETAWLNAYHSRVYESLAPHLNDIERQWLAQATATITPV